MGFFGDLIDDAFELPGKIAEGAAEAVTRLPEIPLRVIDGSIKGVEKGLDKLEEAADELLD